MSAARPSGKRARAVRALVVVTTIALAAAAVVVLSREPRAVRDWADDVRVLATVTESPDGSGFTLHGIRDWRYGDDGPVARDYADAAYAYADLRGMSFYEQRLDRSGLVAHTFVVFEFTPDYAIPNLGISVETRRERDETYGLLKGLTRTFELVHTWANETDLVERRVRYLGYSLTRYRVQQDVTHQRRYLRAFLAQTQALAAEPRWYNTLTTNCTNVIIGVANALDPGFLPFDKAFVLTGFAADYLIGHGILAADGAARIDAHALDAFLQERRAAQP